MRLLHLLLLAALLSFSNNDAIGQGINDATLGERLDDAPSAFDPCIKHTRFIAQVDEAIPAYFENRMYEDSIRHLQKQLYTQIMLADEVSKKHYWIIGLGSLLLLLLIIFLLAKQKAKKRLAAIEIKRKMDMISALIEGQEEERKRMSQELHDGIGAQLVAVKLMMGADNSAKANQVLDKTISDIRNLSHELIPPKIDSEHIEQSLKGYIDSIRDGLSFTISFTSKGTFENLDARQKISIYRIVQECISNAVKHSKASEQNIQIFRDHNTYTLIIEDDGIGFDVQKQFNGIGITNIKSRVESLNGIFRLESVPGHGTTTIIEFNQP
jgi:signal transduction histidine kinase